MKDKVIKKLIDAETKRQEGVLNLIASENYTSQDVREALGSILTNKYAEGYPGKRYYGGNSVIDEIETLCQKRALKAFKLSNDIWSANVQPYSGSPANVAIYMALAPIGSKIMGMRLDMGGHLTHGHAVSATGKIWKQVVYGVDEKTERLNYKELMQIAKKEKPKVLITGFTAYSRVIDFKQFRKIANAVGAVLVVDMSHIAGLVAAGVYPSPFPYADVVMTTTHKTLRGPRAAIIFSRDKFSKAIGKSVFPGLQGGPHVNQIAATAVALEESRTSDFKKYARQVLKNAKSLATSLEVNGWRVISGGTDSHVFLIDTWRQHVGGREASDRLEDVGIIVNKNAIPFDNRSPVDPSGIRIGTAALTTRGMKESDMKKIALLISDTLHNKNFSKTRSEVKKLTKKFHIK
ncbi:MAG: serine hydroxymethyltransferase [bacterium]|nr:serine hydroxymethyltransferase [bacterium]